MSYNGAYPNMKMKSILKELKYIYKIDIEKKNIRIYRR